jgi:hypothetical protein
MTTEYVHPSRLTAPQKVELRAKIEKMKASNPGALAAVVFLDSRKAGFTFSTNRKGQLLNKFLVKPDLSFTEFRMKVNQNVVPMATETGFRDASQLSWFFLVKSHGFIGSAYTMISNGSDSMGQLAAKYTDPETGALLLVLTTENTFG